MQILTDLKRDEDYLTLLDKVSSKLDQVSSKLDLQRVYVCSSSTNGKLTRTYVNKYGNCKMEAINYRRIYDTFMSNTVNSL